MLDLVARGTCGAPGFINHLRPRASPHLIHIDLSAMTFCEPIGLVGIAAFAERALRDDDRVVVTIPDDPNVANYLSRMRLGAVLAALGAEHALPVGPRARCRSGVVRGFCVRWCTRSRRPCGPRASSCRALRQGCRRHSLRRPMRGRSERRPPLRTEARVPRRPAHAPGSATVFCGERLGQGHARDAAAAWSDR